MSLESTMSFGGWRLDDASDLSRDDDAR